MFALGGIERITQEAKEERESGDRAGWINKGAGDEKPKNLQTSFVNAPFRKYRYELLLSAYIMVSFLYEELHARLLYM